MKTTLMIIAAMLSSAALAQTPIASDFPGGVAVNGPKFKYQRPAKTEFTIDRRDWTFIPADWIMAAINAGVPIGVGDANIKKVCERAPKVNRNIVVSQEDAKDFAEGAVPVMDRCIEGQASVFVNRDFNNIDGQSWSEARKACMVKIALRNSRDGFTDWVNVESEAYLCKTDKRIAELDTKLASLPVKFTEMYWYIPGSYPATSMSIVNIGNSRIVVSKTGNVTTVGAVKQ